MKDYIDIHTHSTSSGYFAVRNLYKDFDEAQSGIACTLGLHPWYLNKVSLQQDFNKLKKYAALTNVLAVGECGLDKLTQIPWDLQVTAFTKQIALANDLNKPLIIHCVRAYDEVLNMLKQANIPVVFHGFNKNVQLAERILSAGYYLSFGAAVLNDASNTLQVLAAVPADKFFLETDDSKVAVTDIYAKAASLRKTPLDALILQLRKNFENVFIFR